MEKSQSNAILKHLQDHGSTTSLEAFQLFGETRLSAIIYNLRHKSYYNIETQLETVKTRYGRKTSVARYVLKQDKKKTT